MLSRKFLNFITKNNIVSKLPKRCFSDIMSDREKAEEKNYILRQERKKRKKILQ